MFKTKEGLLCFTTPQEKILYEFFYDISKLKKVTHGVRDWTDNDADVECINAWDVEWLCEDAVKKLNDSLKGENKAK